MAAAAATNYYSCVTGGRSGSVGAGRVEAADIM